MKTSVSSVALLLPFLLFANEQTEDLSTLLEVYKKESDLSNITKRESAGILDLYTREDLEKMQAKNLLDVLKSVAGLYFTRGKKNTIRLAKASTSNLPLTSVRLYINDHDMSSSSFGSAFMVWGEMPISYIDHIELYKATSSIEFGNENASLVIRLYTKNAQREDGSKVQLMADNDNSYNINAYTAQTLNKDLSYFIYAQGDKYNNEIYHNEYQNQIYDLNSDFNDYNVYANINYKNWKLELGTYYKTANPYVGIGTFATPTGGELNSQHSYTHITVKLPKNWKLQLSADYIVYDSNYIDENGIKISDGVSPLPKTIQDYQREFHDTILSAIIEKKTIIGKNQIFFGSFYKYKGFKEEGRFINTTLANPFLITDSYKNALNLFSLYAEDTYNYNIDTKLILSLKGDFYRYDKEVDAQNKYIFRTGIVKNIDAVQTKLFYTDSYIVAAPFQLYSNQIPYKTNPHLKYPKNKILSASIRYKYKKSIFEFNGAYNETKDAIKYDVKEGYINSDGKSIFRTYQFKYTYNFNLKNKLLFDIYYGNNNSGTDASPTNGANLRIYNSFQSFDFYNEFLYKDAYTATYNDTYIESSIDWTAAIKYHYSKDLSFGVRGENILNDSYQVIYNGLNEPLQTVERKVWLNMEYTFKNIINLL